MRFKTICGCVVTLLAIAGFSSDSLVRGQDTKSAEEEIKRELQQVLDRVVSAPQGEVGCVLELLDSCNDKLWRFECDHALEPAVTHRLVTSVALEVLGRFDRESSVDVRKTLMEVFFCLSWQLLLRGEEHWDARSEIEKEAIARFTTEKDTSIRERMVIGLADEGGAEVLTMLKGAIHEESDVRFLAIENLFRLSPERLSDEEKAEVGRLLLTGLSSPDEQIRAGAVLGIILDKGRFVSPSEVEKVLPERIEKEGVATIAEDLGYLLAAMSSGSAKLEALVRKVRRGEIGLYGVRFGVETWFLTRNQHVEEILKTLQSDLEGTDALASAKAARILASTRRLDAWQALSQFIEKPSITEPPEADRQKLALLFWLDSYQGAVDHWHEARSITEGTPDQAKVDDDFSKRYELFTKICQKLMDDPERDPRLRALALIGFLRTCPKTYLEAKPPTHEKWFLSTDTPLVMRKAGLLAAARFWGSVERDGKAVRASIRAVLDNPEDSQKFKRYIIEWLTAMFPLAHNTWQEEFKRILTQPPLGDKDLDAAVVEGMKLVSQESSCEVASAFVVDGRFSASEIFTKLGRAVATGKPSTCLAMLFGFISKDIFSGEEMHIILEVYPTK